MTYDILIDCGKGLKLAERGIKNLKEVRKLFREYNIEGHIFYVRKRFDREYINTMWRIIHNVSYNFYQFEIYKGNQQDLTSEFLKCVGWV